MAPTQSPAASAGEAGSRRLTQTRPVASGGVAVPSTSSGFGLFRSRSRSRSRSRGRRRLFSSPRRDDGTAWGAVAEALHEDWGEDEAGGDRKGHAAHTTAMKTTSCQKRMRWARSTGAVI